MQEVWVQSLDWEDPLEKEMATRSRILARKIPWTEKPGGLQSIGSQIDTTGRLNTRMHQTEDALRDSATDPCHVILSQPFHNMVPYFLKQAEESLTSV